MTKFLERRTSNEQLTVEVATVQALAGSAEMLVAPAGNCSVTLTPVA